MPSQEGLAVGVIGALNGLTSNRSLDRLIRGRAWIGLIAFALIGIVTLQLLVLRLNANIGRALVSEAGLQRTNAALSIENSELAGGERVESLAARLGMQLVPESSLRFLTSDPRVDIARAAAALSAPVHAASSSSSSTTSSSADASSGSSGEASEGSSSESSESSEPTQGAAVETPAAAGATAAGGGEASASAGEASEPSAPAPTATEAAAGGAQAAAPAGGAG